MIGNDELLCLFMKRYGRGSIDFVIGLAYASFRWSMLRLLLSSRKCEFLLSIELVYLLECLECS